MVLDVAQKDPVDEGLAAKALLLLLLLLSQEADGDNGQRLGLWLWLRRRGSAGGCRSERREATRDNSDEAASVELRVLAGPRCRP